ncbi:MAG: hypothetical protein LC798_17090 [Chloroflexi bacterium]|nr:hypothetical protein [Chloroflexota bacterium]
MSRSGYQAHIAIDFDSDALRSIVHVELVAAAGISGAEAGSRMREALEALVEPEGHYCYSEDDSVAFDLDPDACWKCDRSPGMDELDGACWRCWYKLTGEAQPDRSGAPARAER